MQTDRQVLHDQWSFWTNWYKQQPLGHVRYCVHDLVISVYVVEFLECALQRINSLVPSAT